MHAGKLYLPSLRLSRLGNRAGEFDGVEPAHPVRTLRIPAARDECSRIMNYARRIEYRKSCRVLPMVITVSIMTSSIVESTSRMFTIFPMTPTSAISPISPENTPGGGEHGDEAD